MLVYFGLLLNSMSYNLQSQSLNIYNMIKHQPNIMNTTNFRLLYTMTLTDFKHIIKKPHLHLIL